MVSAMSKVRSVPPLVRVDKIASPEAFLTWAGDLLKGPFGGLIGGIISYLLLEMGIKRRRDAHGIAEALAAELLTNAERIGSYLAEDDKSEIPAYFRTYRVVFDAVASRLGELHFEDVASITKLYGFLEEYNRIPTVWHERARAAYGLASGHPVRTAELEALKEAADDFFHVLSGLLVDCEGLATHLHTRYAMGWRMLLPLRLRPARSITAGDRP